MLNRTVKVKILLNHVRDRTTVIIEGVIQRKGVRDFRQTRKDIYKWGVG